MTVVIVQTSLPDADSADRIAGILVDEQLAACVTRIGGAVSRYRWNDVVQRDDEVLLLCKTMLPRYEALRTRLLELHPYELPEIVAVEAAAAHGPYRDWVERSVAVS